MSVRSLKLFWEQRINIYISNMLDIHFCNIEWNYSTIEFNCNTE